MDTKRIPLTRGQFAVVDASDYEFLSRWKWYAAKQPRMFYAARTIKSSAGKKTIWMHRVVNATPDGMKTDHIDGDGLHNCRENLRSVDHQQNMINNQRRAEGRPKYRGVSWHKRNQRWIAQITVDGRNTWIGQFKVQEDARDAYLEARARVRAGQVVKE